MWFKLWIARLLGLNLRLMEIRHHPDELPPMADRVKAMAGIFHLVPGLREEWHYALGEVIGQMAKTPADAAHHGRLIQLCQRAVDLWQCLSLPEKAAADFNALVQQHPTAPQPAHHEMIT